MASIVTEHNRRADPRYAQERIGPAQQFALGLLRDPSVSLPAGAAAAEEALVIERSSTVRQALVQIRNDLSAELVSRDDEPEGSSR
ncbi:MAG: hypothetical protein ACRDWV_04380 [Acidimicrobiales bacterium]